MLRLQASERHRELPLRGRLGPACKILLTSILRG
jgi:hypothetical protein